MFPFRVGHGYDVHVLQEGLRLRIGGVDIPHTHGFVAHSDGDVLIHALCDALLGAAALGDIGKWFPDHDPAYAGANSIQLLQKVCAVLREHGYRPVNIDSTVLAQAPKLAPHIMQMRTILADACGMPIDSISVKATTEEKLGFTGSKEGIAAHAVCLIEQI